MSQRLRKILPSIGNTSFQKFILNSNPLAYWPLNETSGTDILDKTGNGFTGVYSGPTLANTSAPGGSLAPFFDGANDKGTLTSASLLAAINHSEFTTMAWAKLQSAAVWSEAVSRVVFYINVDNSNRAYYLKSTTANKFQFLYNGNSGTTKLQEWTLSSANWMHLVHRVSVSGNAVDSFVDNIKFVPTATTITPYVGSPAIVTGSTGAGAWWKGWISHIIIWNRVLSDDEISRFYSRGL